ncbi:MAG: ribonuclease HII [Myxococcota bacterium]
MSTDSDSPLPGESAEAGASSPSMPPGSTGSTGKPSKQAKAPPLAEFRVQLREAEDEVALTALIERLAGDPRAGAQAIAKSARGAIASARRETARMADLIALRDELAARGVEGIAGVDEVGVGPLAGPVVAGAVVLPETFSLVGLDDSKKVRPARRETLSKEIHACALGVGIGEVPVEEIDQIGIYNASLEAMRRAVASLGRTITLGHLLVDARKVPGIDVPQTSIIKGDSKDASIAAASIVAKVHRDRHMKNLGERYPAYGFEQHMGYGTAVHMEALEREGPCPAHRRSFAPVERAEKRAAYAKASRGASSAPRSS